MTLGRMIYFFVEDRKLAGISAQKYGVIFVWLDIVAFLVQLAGASITSQTGVKQSTIMVGVHLYMGGIGVQEFFIVIFTFLFIKLHRQMLHSERIGTLDLEKSHRGSLNWRWVFYGTYASLGMITVCIQTATAILWSTLRNNIANLRVLLDPHYFPSCTIRPRH